MIVKNEMANLPRCLEAVADHIGCWIIGDTGSSDGTKDFIERFFAERQLPGELHSFPFENFEQARNEALERAYNSKLQYDYLLFSDADMELVVEDSEFRTKIEAPAYQIIQRAGSGLSYWNSRLARRDAGARYHGVTHEYLAVSGETERLQGVWFKDHASGANRVDKFDRDVRLLTEALQRDPENVRYWYYLAQSHRDAGRMKEAAVTYAKRAAMGGWDEEAWNAQLQEARCLRSLEDDGGFLRAALAAFNQRPHRAEPLYDLARFYRERGMPDASVLFSEAGLALPMPDGDILFIEDWIYTFGLLEEFSIGANYSRDPARKERGHAACNWIALSHQVPDSSRNLARSNLYYYVQPLSALIPSFAARPVSFTPPTGFMPLNPSITEANNRLMMIQRTGNWIVTEDGHYRVPDGGPVQTRNFLLHLNLDLGTESVSEIGAPKDWPKPLYGHVLGFEDSRLFTWRQELWCSSTVRELRADGVCQQVLARIEQDQLDGCHLTDWRVLESGNGNPRDEKNWMPRIAGDTLHFVYLCDPTRIVDEFGRCVAEMPCPIAGDQFRGGSQAIRFDGGWLALVHEVTFLGGKRCYQHRFVWFDETNALRRVSRRFVFQQKGIEFAAGMVLHPDGKRLLISYGIGDREAWIATVDANEVRRVLEDADLPALSGHRSGNSAMGPSVVMQKDDTRIDRHDTKTHDTEHEMNIHLPNSDHTRLSKIFDRWGTDKVVNGYADLYDCLFRKIRREINAVLEIGIGTMIPGVHSSMVGFAPQHYKPGASLRGWRDFFPNAMIYGADVQPDTQFDDEDRIKTFLCNSTNSDQVHAMMQNIQQPKLDIIIDDGSHLLDDQLATLRNLFPRLRDGGTYIVEDIISSGLYYHTNDIVSICGSSPFFFSGPQNNPLVIVKIAQGDGGDAHHKPGALTKQGAPRENAPPQKNEERWYAKWSEARRLRNAGDGEAFVAAALEALELRPHRAEPLHELSWYHLEQSQQEIAAKYAEVGMSLPFPEYDQLGLEPQIYQTGLREAFSIAANYSRDPVQKARGESVCNWLALSRDTPQQNRDTARRNLAFYARPLRELAPSFAAHRLTIEQPEGWCTGNPGIVRWGDDILCVVRAVRHTINDHGICSLPRGEGFISRNYLTRLDDKFVPTSVHEISMPTDWPAPQSSRALGFEDCRPFVWRYGLWVSATVSEMTPTGWCEIALARIEHSADTSRFTDWRILRPEGPKRNEKNWMPWVDGDTLRFVYLVDPGRVLDDQAGTVREGPPGLALDHIRGGSQLVPFDDAWLAITHEVAVIGSGVRRYLHRWVSFDRDGIAQRVSPAFSLINCEIEFATGLLWHTDGKRLVMSFGRWDRETWISTVSASEVRSMLTFSPHVAP